MSRDIAQSFGGVHRMRAGVSRTTHAATSGGHLGREIPQSPRPQENQVTIGANTSLDDAAAGDYGAVPWGQTSIPVMGQDTNAAAMVVRQLMQSPATAQQVQALVANPRALLENFANGQTVGLGALGLRLDAAQIDDIQARLNNGELNDDSLGAALLTMGIQNEMDARSATDAGDPSAFQSVMDDLGLEATLVKLGQTGAEVGDFVIYGDERRLMQIASINPDGAYTLEDAYGERITANSVLAAEKKIGQDDNDQPIVFEPTVTNVSLGPQLTGNYRRPRR